MLLLSVSSTAYTAETDLLLSRGTALSAVGFSSLRPGQAVAGGERSLAEPQLRPLLELRPFSFTHAQLVDRPTLKP